MENSSYIALSRQMTLANEMNVVANNIANANTPAYKAEKMVFREFMEKPLRGEQLSFVQDVGMARDLREGNMMKTDNALDVAISGEGYFIVDTPTGERYTRHGRFQLNADGQLVNSEGHALRGGAGPLVVPPDSEKITIAPDGTVSTNDGVINKLQLVKFEDEQALRKGANGLYSAEQDPQPVENPHILQGMLEDSNVEPILELTRMITVQREYQSVQSFIKKEDDRLSKAIQRLTQNA